MQLHTLNRLLKGMAITGVWMCFEEFNRLNYRVLAFVGEQLSILMKYRNFGHNIEVNYNQDVIYMKPCFQFCTTYNPGYSGRR